MLRIYQLTLSPLLGPRCRYYPSCSNYAMTAVRTHGFWRGLWLSAKRLGRCHPGHPGGIDEVPGVPARKNQVPGNRVLQTQTRCACSSDLTNQ